MDGGTGPKKAPWTATLVSEVQFTVAGRKKDIASTGLENHSREIIQTLGVVRKADMCER